MLKASQKQSTLIILVSEGRSKHSEQYVKGLPSLSSTTKEAMPRHLLHFKLKVRCVIILPPIASQLHVVQKAIVAHPGQQSYLAQHQLIFKRC